MFYITKHMPMLFAFVVLFFPSRWCCRKFNKFSVCMSTSSVVGWVLSAVVGLIAQFKLCVCLFAPLFYDKSVILFDQTISFSFFGICLVGIKQTYLPDRMRQFFCIFHSILKALQIHVDLLLFFFLLLSSLEQTIANNKIISFRH